MGKLIRNPSSAGELASKRFAEAAASAADRYPDGAIFIGSDEEHFAAVLAEAVDKLQPLVIVYPDGEELIGEPQAGRLIISASTGPNKFAKAFAHPLRVQAWTILNEHPSDSGALARQLDESSNLIAYHLKILLAYGLIELTETTEVRGATVHIYRAADIPREIWEPWVKRLTARERT